jgi:hypothetical protein
MAYIRTLANGNYRADVRMKGIVKNKTFPSQSQAHAWADKIGHSIKTIANLETAQLLALSDADIDSMGGDELFKQLGVDLFSIRNQALLSSRTVRVPGGTYSPSVDEGYYAILKPFSVGNHIVHILADAPGCTINGL